jgi:hypothetical protein
LLTIPAQAMTSGTVDDFKYVDSLLVQFKNKEALTFINLKLLSGNDQQTLLKWNVRKVRALSQVEEFGWSIDLGTQLLKNPELKKSDKIKVLLDLALGYEYLGQQNLCAVALNEV